MERMTIEFEAADEAEAGVVPSPTVIEYVGGPRDGEREVHYGHEPPSVMIIQSPAGSARSYRRSVRCADDKILRYIWDES